MKGFKLISKKTGSLVVLSVVILATVLMVFRLFSPNETDVVLVKINSTDVGAMESITSEVDVVKSNSADADVAKSNPGKSTAVEKSVVVIPFVQEVMPLSDFLVRYKAIAEPANTDMSDQELLDFVLRELDRLNALYGSSLRADRYSIEQLVLIGKFLKRLPVSEDELSDLLPFYLDINLRIHVENLRIEEQEGGAFVGKEEWIAAHAYQDDISYWESLVSEGDNFATRILSGFYQNAKYTDKAIQTYEVGLLRGKTRKDNTYFAQSLAGLYKDDDARTAAIYYLLSNEYLDGNYAFPELEEIVKEFDRNELLEEARKKYEQLEIFNQ